MPGRLDDLGRARYPALRQFLCYLRVGALVGRDQAVRRNVLDLKPQPRFGLFDKAVAQRCQVGEKMDAAPAFLEPSSAGLHLFRRQRLLIEHLRLAHLVDGLKHADLLAHVGKIGREHGDDMALALDQHEVVQPRQRIKGRFGGVEHDRRLAPARDLVLQFRGEQTEDEDQDAGVILHLLADALQVLASAGEREARELDIMLEALEHFLVMREQAFVAELALIDWPVLIFVAGILGSLRPPQEQSADSGLLHEIRLSGYGSSGFQVSAAKVIPFASFEAITVRFRRRAQRPAHLLATTSAGLRQRKRQPRPQSGPAPTPAADS